MLNSSLLHIDPRDDVAVALRPVLAGEAVAEGVAAAVDIAAGHKVALHPIAAGEEVRKYGWPIGRARTAISAGEHVHTHNLVTGLSGVEDYSYLPIPAEPPRAAAPMTFEGYRRANGRVGTRNEIWILSTVGCVARTAQKIAA